MFKFLRKYNKWILAVGGGLLMIVFLMGDVIPRLTQSVGAAGRTQATVGANGRERVPAREWAQYVAQADFIRSIERSQGQPVLQVGHVEGPEHWYLLVREAKAAGLVSPPAATGLTDEQLLGVTSRTMTPETVRNTYANLFGVERMLNLYLDSGGISDNRLRNYAARVFHAVDIEAAVIPARGEVIQVEPTEQDVAAHFERFKDYAPGEGPMGLGYRLPNRVKIEWLEITADSVRQAITDSEQVSGVALRQHWRLNPDGVFPPVDAARPVPYEVRQDLINRLTEERLERITTFINGQLTASRRTLTQREGYYLIPDDWNDLTVNFVELAQTIQQRHDIPLPSYHAIGDRWLRLTELNTLPGIGTATTDRYGLPEKRLQELVSASKEFGGSMSITIQSKIAGPPLRDRNGGIYVFRVTEADASRPPHDVDEVRNDLIADLRRITAFDVLVERSSEIKQLAMEQSMLSLSLDFDAEMASKRVTLANAEILPLYLQVGLPLEVTPSDLPIIGSHRPTVEAILDHARSLPMNVSVEELPAPDRYLVIPVEDRLALVVVRITGQQPLTMETYAELAGTGVVQRLMLSEELDGVENLQDAFGLETLTKRHNLRVTRGRDDEDDFIE